MEAESTHVAHHFPNLRQQEHAARLGMWLFLATELLLFGGLFTAYAIYRYLYAPTFHEASKLLNTPLGTINTVVLITSSLSVALAHHYVQLRKGRTAALALLVTLVFAVVFLIIKGFEWSHDFHVGLLPGKFFANREIVELLERGGTPGAAAGLPMFFTIYFIMTGLHAVHVVIGMAILFVLMVLCWRGRYDHGYVTPVELGGMYWHLVDLVWIFLFPLFYLI